MKVACDRCLKIAPEDSIEVARNWLNISTGGGLKYLFCEKCANVFWKTMFNCDKKDDNSDDPTIDDIIKVVRCKDCVHRDPEDKKCDCGSQARQGCPFPVDDNYFCGYGERKEGENE